MPLPEPEIGLVIRYSYLWSHEYEQGQEDGRKDRPCAIVLTQETIDDTVIVTVAPITHTEPDGDTVGIEVPVKTGSRLGLDGERSWVIVTELNRFVWPGPDLRPIISENGEKEYSYGILPNNFYQKVLCLLKAEAVKRRISLLPRTD